MVQIEVAGPRLPQTFNIAPDDIRHMANVVLQECVYGAFDIGGFTTSDLQVMTNWIKAEETKLDRPFRMSHLILHSVLSFASERSSISPLTILLQQHPPHTSP